MAKSHHVNVKCSDELWKAYRVRCMQLDVDLGVRLAQLVASDLGVPIEQQPAAIDGQLVLSSTKRKRPAKPRPSGAAKSRVAARKKTPQKP